LDPAAVLGADEGRADEVAVAGVPVEVGEAEAEPEVGSAEGETAPELVGAAMFCGPTAPSPRVAANEMPTMTTRLTAAAITTCSVRRRPTCC
jgi:uncharacterized membrane protein